MRGMLALWRILGFRRLLALLLVRKAWQMYRRRSAARSLPAG
jgi:hypothetical protein